MPVEIESFVGPQAPNAQDGAPINPYFGRMGQTVVQDLLPRYLEASYRGFTYCGANQASQAVSNLSTTATGLILINPLGSGKALWLIDLILAEASAIGSAVPAVTLAANVAPVVLTSYTLTTPLTVQPTLVGAQSTSVARLLSAATLPATPVILRSIWGALDFGTVPTTGSPNPYIKDEIAGAVGIAPGCSVSLSATAAVSVIASITWLELPYP